MKDILKKLNQKPIAYFPIYRQITGSTTGGILLSQLMYWFSKKDKIFKTDNEIMEETYLSKKELENAKKLIKNLDFITVSREGLPAKTYYEINWEKMLSSFHERGKLESPKSGNSTTRNGETILPETGKHSIYTENTTENTTDIKKEKEKNEIFFPENLNIQAFEMWCEYKGNNYSKQGKILSINKLVQYPQDIQLQMVENSIMNNYKGLFEIKQTGTALQQQSSNKTIEEVLVEYMADRRAGTTRDIATLQAKQKLNWGLHKELQRVIADFEYKIYQRTAPKENKEAYDKFIAENSPI